MMTCRRRLYDLTYVSWKYFSTVFFPILLHCGKKFLVVHRKRGACAALDVLMGVLAEVHVGAVGAVRQDIDLGLSQHVSNLLVTG